MKNIELAKNRYGAAASFIISFKRSHGGKLPWTQAYNNIITRCRGYNRRDRVAYSSRGFSCEIRPSQLRELFMRDKAWAMKQPSVDRINPDIGYTKENVRWLPMEENRKMRMMNHPAREESYQRGKKLIEDFFSTTNWPYYLKRAFVLKYLKDLITKRRD